MILIEPLVILMKVSEPERFYLIYFLNNTASLSTFFHKALLDASEARS